MAMASVAASAFGEQLFAQLLPALAKTGGQAIISPLSVWFALLLLLNGAGPNSQTQNELWAAIATNGNSKAAGTPMTAMATAAFNNQSAALASRLRAQQSGGGGVQLSIASSIWTKDLAILPGYAALMKVQFGAPVQAVRSVDPINAWAADVTRGMITQAVPPNTPFNMIATNAVYFKGLWEYAFDKGATRKAPFTTGSGSNTKVVQVDMMSRTFKPRELRGAASIRYAEVPGAWRGIRLPYKGGTASAVLVLPDKAKHKGDVYAAAADLTASKVVWKAPYAPLFDVGALSVSLPRFKVSVNQLSLTKALNSMGVTAAFDPKAADFTQISDVDGLVVSNVLQSAVVQVDESGTEAAAVTSVVMVTTAFVPNATPPLVFDRPFLFFLVDEATQSVLFQGVVSDPSK